MKEPFSIFTTFAPFASLCVLCSLCLIAPASFAADEDIPTDVTADRMYYDADENTVHFESNVVIVHGDFTIHCDNVTMVLLEDSATKPNDAAKTDTLDAGKIEKIIASKKVCLAMKSKKGTCEKATYFAQKAMVRMEGNPVLYEEKNSVQGHIINFYIDENRSEVLSAPDERVRAVFSSTPKARQ